MNWKLAAAGVGVAAIISAPIVSAAPGGNGKKPVNPPGQTISQIAKNGGGPVAILSALAAAHPNNKGLQNALKRVTANQTKTTTPSPTTQTTPPTTTSETTPPTTTSETTPPTSTSVAPSTP